MIFCVLGSKRMISMVVEDVKLTLQDAAQDLNLPTIQYFVPTIQM